MDYGTYQIINVYSHLYELITFYEYNSCFIFIVSFMFINKN